MQRINGESERRVERENNHVEQSIQKKQDDPRASQDANNVRERRANKKAAGGGMRSSTQI